MGVFDIFSKRQKRQRGEYSDVYVYDVLPSALRSQIVMIIDGAIGPSDQWHQSTVSENYEGIVKLLRKEYGVFNLPPTKDNSRILENKELFDFILNVDTEQCLDAVEVSFVIIEQCISNYQYIHGYRGQEVADEAVSELNARFKEHAVGYQFENSRIIRIDSTFVHVEITKKAITLLNSKNYAGAEAEFMKAHEHYRHGRYKEALNDSLKTFESVMKSICIKRGWPLNGNETSSKLLQICFDNNLIPSFWQTQFNGLKSILESSVPTARNRLSGHGQGMENVSVPDYIAAYVIHMAASAAVFLVKADEKLA